MNHESSFTVNHDSSFIVHCSKMNDGSPFIVHCSMDLVAGELVAEGPPG